MLGYVASNVKGTHMAGNTSRQGVGAHSVSGDGELIEEPAADLEEQIEQRETAYAAEQRVALEAELMELEEADRLERAMDARATEVGAAQWEEEGIARAQSRALADQGDSNAWVQRIDQLAVILRDAAKRRAEQQLALADRLAARIQALRHRTPPPPGLGERVLGPSLRRERERSEWRAEIARLERTVSRLRKRAERRLAYASRLAWESRHDAQRVLERRDPEGAKRERERIEAEQRLQAERARLERESQRALELSPSQRQQKRARRR